MGIVFYLDTLSRLQLQFSDLLFFKVLLTFSADGSTLLFFIAWTPVIHAISSSHGTITADGAIIEFVCV